MAEATRRKVYHMLVAEKMRVKGFHYPFRSSVRAGPILSGWRHIAWRGLRAFSRCTCMTTQALRSAARR